MPYEESRFRQESRLAAVFIDYQNLYTLLKGRLDASASPDDHIAEALDELRRYLLDEDSTRTAKALAYADFHALDSHEQIERALYARGMEPRFVPASLQENASEVQLCVDAVDLLHQRPDIRTFVLVTGNRAYLPLVQMFKQYGRHVFVVALDPPPAADSFEFAEGDVFLDLLNLVGEPMRQRLLGGSGSSYHTQTARTTHHAPDEQDYRSLTDPMALHALHIAEEHFGQYDEIYLTPLLRKLSEMLGDECDPKSLVSELEAAGAVRLEKREGYPYDYTVLIIHYDHPDVQEIKAELQEADGTAESDVPSSYMDDYADLEQRFNDYEEQTDGDQFDGGETWEEEMQE